ncbi:MAG: hypothetical protein M0R03_06995 [Novosphingobium sp.]|nr:hypothetical protein [Novosphingobium sp.]
MNRHLPDRQQAPWDGRSYVSTCRRCGAAIRRRKHNRWERDWLEGPPENAR